MARTTSDTSWRSLFQSVLRFMTEVSESPPTVRYPSCPVMEMMGKCPPLVRQSPTNRRRRTQFCRLALTRGAFCRSPSLSVRAGAPSLIGLIGLAADLSNLVTQRFGPALLGSRSLVKPTIKDTDHRGVPVAAASNAPLGFRCRPPPMITNRNTNRQKTESSSLLCYASLFTPSVQPGHDVTGFIQYTCSSTFFGALT